MSSQVPLPLPIAIFVAKPFSISPTHGPRGLGSSAEEIPKGFATKIAIGR